MTQLRRLVAGASPTILFLISVERTTCDSFFSLPTYGRYSGVFFVTDGFPKAACRCSLFPIVLAFCNYRRTTLVALDNKEIREHARTENNVVRGMNGTPARGG
jgi:hypothetical protein